MGINLTRLNAGALRRLDQEHRSARTLHPRSGAAELSLPVPAECTVKLRELLTVSEYAPTASGSGTTRCWSHRQPPMQRPRAVRGEGIKGKVFAWHRITSRRRALNTSIPLFDTGSDNPSTILHAGPHWTRYLAYLRRCPPPSHRIAWLAMSAV